jgi:dienelactone hydrolase
MEGYITENDAAKHLVIMIHEWWGFNTSITKTADLFSAKKSLRVFVPDLYRGSPAKNA